jgi:hypothetical protein
MAFRSMWVWSVVLAAVLAAVGSTWVSAVIGFAVLMILLITAVAGIPLAMAVQDEANDQSRAG